MTSPIYLLRQILQTTLPQNVREKERKKEREREMYRNIDKKQKERNTFIVKSLNRFKTFTQN